MFIYIVIFVIVLLWLLLGEKEALSRKKLMKWGRDTSKNSVMQFLLSR